MDSLPFIAAYSDTFPQKAVMRMQAPIRISEYLSSKNQCSMPKNLPITDPMRLETIWYREKCGMLCYVGNAWLCNAIRNPLLMNQTQNDSCFHWGTALASQVRGATYCEAATHQ